MSGTGTLKTTATWIREFVRSHPAYKQDSVISQEINYDLVKAIDEIEKGTRKAEDLLGKNYVGSDRLQIDMTVSGMVNVTRKD